MMDSEKQKSNSPRLLVSVRFMLTVILFFGYCFNYMQKIDLGIAIVCMLNNTALKQLQQQHQQQTAALSHFNLTNTYPNNSLHSQCKHSANALKKYDGPFVWEKNTQGLILSAFFYGYILTQIPGGWLSFKYGGRIMLGLSMLIGSTITMFLPFLARFSYKALIVGLFFTGAAHGAFWPSVSSFWAYWAPSSERSRLVGMSSAGAKFGNIFALSFGGFLCIQGFDGGWPSIFYIFGLLGVLWCVFLFVLTTNSPSKHKFIGEEEKHFILVETKKAIETKKICESKVPWKEILTSKVCIALFVGHFSHNWGNYLFLTQIPSFLKDVLKFDIKSNGFISSIPYIVSLFTINISSVLSDHLCKSEKISKQNVRRLFIGCATIIPSFLIIALSFIDCRQVYLGVCLLSIGVGLDSIMSGAGHLVNINDIAGPYSGILFGISNTIATIPGILSPYLAGVLTKNQTQQEWQIVFLICAFIYFFGGIFYMIFVESETQPWAKIDMAADDEKEENESKKNLFKKSSIDCEVKNAERL